MTASKIEWTDRSDWNPIRGCTRVSRGCGGPGKAGGCYAERIAARFSDPGQPFHSFAKRVNGEARWTGKVALIEDRLTEPLRWRKPAKIFVCSTADLFHEALPDGAIDQVFAVMALCPQHTFQILTKRPERMAQYFLDPGRIREQEIGRALLSLGRNHGTTDPLAGFYLPLPNVWLGVSVEDQATADARIPVLLRTPAAKRFISAEPLLGPVDLGAIVRKCTFDGTIHADGKTHPIGWVIAGGESGPGARPAHPDWFRALRDQCAAASVPFFFKQWGSWFPTIDRDVDDPDWRWGYTVVRDQPARYCFLNLAGGCGFHGERVHLMQRYAKRATGAILDGREHREFPL